MYYILRHDRGNWWFAHGVGGWLMNILSVIDRDMSDLILIYAWTMAVQ